MSMLSQLKSDFLDSNADVIIPSPLEIARHTICLAMDFRDACVAHVKEVRKQQEEFQQRIQAVGIERLMRLKPHEVLDMYG